MKFLKDCPLEKLRPYERNPRKNEAAVDAVLKSLARFGAISPIIADSSFRICAGHTRYQAAIKAGLKTFPVLVADQLEGDLFTAFNIADNQTSSLATWDNAQLAVLLQELAAAEFPTDDLGFTEKQLRLIMAELEKEDHSGQDDIPDVPDQTEMKAGQVWQLGDHRLVCGDATKIEPEGETLFWDPPWDVEIVLPEHDWKHRLVFTDGGRLGQEIRRFGPPTWFFVWDCQGNYYTGQTRPLRRYKGCLWYGDIGAFRLDGAFHGEVQTKAYKGRNKRGDFEYTPDPRGKRMTDLFEMSIAQLHGNGEHSHEKPVDWIRLLIGCCTVGDVYDPCAGSGSTIIACEQLGRRCVAAEIEPRYCDVIVRRWEQYTGRKAERAV